MKYGLVSIIMPAYNASNFIEKTIQSVMNQSYVQWELLIIDDNSTDNTRELLELIESKDDRIKCYFPRENGGAGICRNIGLDNASGQYIAFLDSDDVWDEKKLELQIVYMKENNAPICHTSFSFINESGQGRKGFVKASKVIDLESNLKTTEIGTSTAIIDRNIIIDNFRFSTIRARQDIKLWIHLLGLGYKSYGLNIPLVKYRIREGSVSSNKFKMLFITFKVYMGASQLSLPKRISCYLSYVINAIRKRA